MPTRSDSQLFNPTQSNYSSIVCFQNWPKNPGTAKVTSSHSKQCSVGDTHQWWQLQLPVRWHAAVSCGTYSVHCGNTEGVSSTFPVLVTMVFQVYPFRLQPLNRDQHHHCPHLLGTATLVPLVVHCLVTETHLPGQPYPSSVLQKASNVSMKFK